jgi:Anti-sigma-K factor rskA
MSDEDRRSPTDRCGADAAAYALGALEPAKVGDFELHLAQCHSCARDLAGFQHVVDRLPTSSPQYQAPRGLRRRVMGRVSSEPRQYGGSRQRGRSSPMTLVSRAWPRRAGLAGSLVVGLVLVLLAIGRLVPGGSRESRVLTSSVVDSPASAHLRLAGGRAELIVRHFPPPAVGYIYEVWLRRPGRAPEPTTVLFSVNGQGAGDIGVPDTLKGVTEILVTQEPVGGSAVPTRLPVILGRLS